MEQFKEIMEIQNELRRTRQKLELFDKPMFNEVLLDLIDQVTADAGLGVYATKTRLKFIEGLKTNYLQNIKLLTPPNPKQIKLNL